MCHEPWSPLSPGAARPPCKQGWGGCPSQVPGASPPLPFRGCRLRKRCAGGRSPAFGAAFGWGDLPAVGVEVAPWAPEDVVLCCSQDGQPLSGAQVGASGSVGLVGSVCRAAGDCPVSRAVRAPCARWEVLGGTPCNQVGGPGPGLSEAKILKLCLLTTELEWLLKI